MQQCCVAVAGLADDVHVGLLLEQRAQAFAHDRVVVYQQDPDRLSCSCSGAPVVARHDRRRSGCRGRRGDDAQACRRARAGARACCPGPCPRADSSGMPRPSSVIAQAQARPMSADPDTRCGEGAAWRTALDTASWHTRSIASSCASAWRRIFADIDMQPHVRRHHRRQQPLQPLPASASWRGAGRACDDGARRQLVQHRRATRRRPAATARRGAPTRRSPSAGSRCHASAQRLRDQAHRRQDLGDVVVQVARQPLPFLQQRDLCGALEQARVDDRQPEVLGDDLQADAVELVERAVGFDVEHAEHDRRRAGSGSRVRPAAGARRAG